MSTASALELEHSLEFRGHHTELAREDVLEFRGHHTELAREDVLCVIRRVAWQSGSLGALCGRGGSGRRGVREDPWNSGDTIPISVPARVWERPWSASGFP